MSAAPISVAAGAAIAVVTAVAMEGVAAVVHARIMHGWGWGWHRSHHQAGDSRLQRNDLYAVVFACISAGLMALGGAWWEGAWWIGIGMAGYGVLYTAVHDGLVHRRWPLRYVPRGRYLRRLVRAHHIHHARLERDGCVSFGFLYAPQIERLRARLRERDAARRR